MAKWYADKISKKYGWNGKNYRDLMTEIIAKNSEHIGRAIGRIQAKTLDNQMSKISTEKKPITIPDLEEVLPKRSVYIRKAAYKGQLINDTLRDRLTKDLRGTLEDYFAVSNIREYHVKNGRQLDIIPKALIEDMKLKVKDTFEGYIKTNPKYGVPDNINAIATTEVRSTINEIKDSYMRKLVDKNPGVEITKTWIHNDGLSEEARPGHKRLNGKTLPLNEHFSLENWKKTAGGKWMLVGITSCSHPHDPALPPEQVIQCNCDIVYSASKPEKVS